MMNVFERGIEQWLETNGHILVMEGFPSDLRLGRTLRERGRDRLKVIFSVWSPSRLGLFQQSLIWRPRDSGVFVEAREYRKYPWWRQAIDGHFNAAHITWLPWRLEDLAKEAGLPWNEVMLFDPWVLRDLFPHRFPQPCHSIKTLLSIFRRALDSRLGWSPLTCRQVVLYQSDHCRLVGMSFENVELQQLIRDTSFWHGIVASLRAGEPTHQCKIPRLSSEQKKKSPA